jgi:hypothetical protein
MDSQVTITKVSDQVGFHPVTSLPLTSKLITFTVGEHGPFNLTVPANDFTPEKVQAHIDNTVATLRAIGAVK